MSPQLQHDVDLVPSRAIGTLGLVLGAVLLALGLFAGPPAQGPAPDTLVLAVVIVAVSLGVHARADRIRREGS